jgi:hypothetical protein
MIVVLAKYYDGDQVKEDGRGMLHAWTGSETHICGFVGTPEGRGHLKDPGLDERMILKCILKIGCEGMDFIRLVRDTCRELGDELVGPLKCGTFFGYLKT